MAVTGVGGAGNPILGVSVMVEKDERMGTTVFRVTRLVEEEGNFHAAVANLSPLRN